MTTIVMDKAAQGGVTGHGLGAVGELVLRLVGAALLVIATLVVVRSLTPAVAGVYFEGFVIAYALAAVLRGKYEMLAIRYVLGECELKTSIPVIDLLAALGRRIAIRCTLICGILLVLTADLDIMEPRLQPFLGTFLPFVLAVPFISVAMFLAAALRAAGRSLGSAIISAYSINLAIMGAAVLPLSADTLSSLSWAFLAGAVVASAIGILLARKVFHTAPRRGVPKPCVADWRQIYGSAALDYGIAGLAWSGLQWGPLCVLAVVGPSLQIAEIAVTLRLALIVDLMMPSLVFVPLGLNLAPRVTQALRTERGQLVANLAFSTLAATGLAVVLMILVPPLLREFGTPYTGLTGLFAVMLAAQWINGAARPALRFMTTHHYKPVIFALGLGAVAALAVTFLEIDRYGAFAVAAATLVGMLILNAHSLIAALRKSSRSAVASTTV